MDVLILRGMDIGDRDAAIKQLQHIPLGNYVYRQGSVDMAMPDG